MTQTQFATVLIVIAILAWLADERGVSAGAGALGLILFAT
jgi:hypothetical protein